MFARLKALVAKIPKTFRVPCFGVCNTLRVLVLAAAVLWLVLWASAALSAGSQSDDISWTMPTARVDATPLPISELVSTEVRVRAESGTLVTSVVVPVGTTTWTYDRGPAPHGTLCYEARVLDTGGLYSDWSAPMCKTVKAKPNAPGNLSIK